MALYRTSGANPTGDAVETNVLSGKIFSNDSGTDKVGTMPNNGAVSPSALSPNGTYTIPEGYHNGNGVVTASPNTGTYSPTTRDAALDMGISNLNRYVNTNGVPNSNSGTYTFPANDTGGTKDLGETNTYRYVNATNVYNKGKADGQSGVETTLWTNPSPTSSFSRTTITLSKSFVNFNKIRIYYRISTSMSTTYYIDVPPNLLSNSIGSGNKPNVIVCSLESAGQYSAARKIYYVSNTSLTITDSSGVGAQATYNSFTIITKISGIS